MQNPMPVTALTHTEPPWRTRLVTRYLPTAARILLGAFMLMFGLMGLLGLAPAPPADLPAAAIAFNTGMAQTGYMFPLLAGTQALTGAMLLTNRWVPLALTLLAPFIVNSLAFHLFLVPAGLPAIVLVLLLELYLAWTYRAAYRSMLALRVAPYAA